MLLGEHGADQPHDRRAIREDDDHVGASADLAVQPLQHVESFNGKLRDECLNLERFDTLLEAQVLIEGWRCEYNQLRRHSTLGYRPPAPEAAPEPVSRRDGSPPFWL